MASLRKQQTACRLISQLGLSKSENEARQVFNKVQQ